MANQTLAEMLLKLLGFFAPSFSYEWNKSLTVSKLNFTGEIAALWFNFWGKTGQNPSIILSIFVHKHK